MRTPSARASSGVDACCMRSRMLSGTETRRSFFMNSALRRLVSGQIPAMTGIRKPSMRFKKAEIEYGLRDSVLGSGLDFIGEAANLIVDVWHSGVRRAGDGESGGRADRIAA